MCSKLEPLNACTLADSKIKEILCAQPEEPNLDTRLVGKRACPMILQDRMLDDGMDQVVEESKDKIVGVEGGWTGSMMDRRRGCGAGGKVCQVSERRSAG